MRLAGGAHKSGKDTRQLSLSKPIPVELVGEVAALLAEQRASSSVPAATNDSAPRGGPDL